jgi:hypothetical protein
MDVNRQLSWTSSNLRIAKLPTFWYPGILLDMLTKHVEHGDEK